MPTARLVRDGKECEEGSKRQKVKVAVMSSLSQSLSVTGRESWIRCMIRKACRLPLIRTLCELDQKNVTISLSSSHGFQA